MHLAARHQSGEDTERGTRPLSLKNLVHIAVSKHNTTSMEFRRFVKGNPVHWRQTKLLDDTVIIRGLSAPPGVDDKVVVRHIIPPFVSFTLPRQHQGFAWSAAVALGFEGVLCWPNGTKARYPLCRAHRA